MLLNLAPALARAVADAGFTAHAVRELLGDVADNCRVAGEFDLPLVTLGEPDSQLAALTRLFLLPTGGESAVSAEVVNLALPGLKLTDLTAAGLLCETSPGCFTATLALTPHTLTGAGHTRNWLVLSDVPRELSRAELPADYVMGVGGATRTLLSHIGEVRNKRVFELGTGCGIVALHLAAAGADVVATDISARALTFARVNEILNGVAAACVQWRLGSLFAPVQGERFELLVSNPPFVISPAVADSAADMHTDEVRPAASAVLEYRSTAHVGDALSRELITAAHTVLLPGGELICLANWEATGGEQPLATVRGWAAQAGADSAFIVQRENLTPAEYAAMWHRDSGSSRHSLAAALSDFMARDVTSIGMGVVHLRAAEAGTATAPVIFAQELVGAPLGEGFAAALASCWQAAEFAQRLGSRELLQTRWQCAPHVDDVRTFAPGAADPHRIVLHSQAPYSAVVESETLAAALLGACDGELTLGQLADALAEVLALPADAVSQEVVAVVRHLAPLGFLTPCLASV